MCQHYILINLEKYIAMSEWIEINGHPYCDICKTKVTDKFEEYYDKGGLKWYLCDYHTNTCSSKIFESWYTEKEEKIMKMRRSLSIKRDNGGIITFTNGRKYNEIWGI